MAEREPSSKSKLNEKQHLLHSKRVNKDTGYVEPHCISARHVLAIMAFLGFINIYALRVNLSIAIVAMVNSTPDSNKNDSNECPSSGGVNSTHYNNKVGEFDWDEPTQGYILAGFFYGYILTQIPGGWLAAHIGGKALFGWGVFCTSALTLVTPLAARQGVYLLIAVRVISGICEGVTYPAMYAMWGHWAPVWERSRLLAFATAGSRLGLVFTLLVSGVLCDSDFMGGWPSVFYVFVRISNLTVSAFSSWTVPNQFSHWGGCTCLVPPHLTVLLGMIVLTVIYTAGIGSTRTLGCIWFVAWMLLIHNSPAEHPRISREEREYIENSIGKKENLATPWKFILTSPAVMSLCVAQIATSWGIFLLITCLPTYLKTILKFGIKENGLLSALPYAVMCVVQISAGYLADYVRSRGYLTTKNTRKVFNSIGLLIPGTLLIVSGYIGCDHILVTFFLTLSIGFTGFVYGGSAVNHLDIAPRFAGVLMGLSSAIGAIPGFLTPVVVGVLTENNQTMEQWHKIFFINGFVSLLGCIIYNIFAEGKELPWAHITDKTLTNGTITHNWGSEVQENESSMDHRSLPPVYTQ